MDCFGAIAEVSHWSFNSLEIASAWWQIGIFCPYSKPGRYYVSARMA